jgi:hypothetical protein
VILGLEWFEVGLAGVSAIDREEFKTRVVSGREERVPTLHLKKIWTSLNSNENVA